MLAVLAACAILLAAISAGWVSGLFFDTYHQVDGPRAYAAGEPEQLTTLRLALFLFVFQTVVIAHTLLAAGP